MIITLEKVGPEEITAIKQRLNRDFPPEINILDERIAVLYQDLEKLSTLRPTPPENTAVSTTLPPRTQEVLRLSGVDLENSQEINLQYTPPTSSDRPYGDFTFRLEGRSIFPRTIHDPSSFDGLSIIPQPYISYGMEWHHGHPQSLISFRAFCRDGRSIFTSLASRDEYYREGLLALESSYRLHLLTRLSNIRHFNYHLELVEELVDLYLNPNPQQPTQ